MSLFNRKSKATKTTNLAGGNAYKQTPALELVSILLTSFAQDRFYESGEATMQRMVKLLMKVDPLFAAKAAVFARNEYGMRSISHVLAAELAAYASGTAWAKDFYTAIVRRPDDMMEILAYYMANGGAKVPNAMKKGFAAAFDKFDGYQLAKYRGENKAVKLVDVVNLVHPVPTLKNATALQQLVDGTLVNTGTWEAMLTEAGQTAKNDVDKAKRKAKVWKDLLSENRLGYFALLRNLRNISTQAPRLIGEVCKQLTNRQKIRKSLVLPFRLLTAYKQMDRSTKAGRQLSAALAKAVDLACMNVPNLKNTLVVIDNSGSMGCQVAGSKHLKCNEAGALFGMMLAKRCNADIMEFGTTARYISYGLNTSVLDFAQNFAANNKVGHGTNFHSIFQTAKGKYERIVIFSDMQGWMGGYTPKTEFANYKRCYKVDPYVYSFDLAGHGTMQFPEQKVCTLAGFSEKVFDLMKTVEMDKRALIRQINAIEL